MVNHSIKISLHWYKCRIIYSYPHAPKLIDWNTFFRYIPRLKYLQNVKFSLLLLLVPGLGRGRGQLWSNKERSVLLNQWGKSHFRHFTGVCKNDSAGHPPGSNTDCVLRARLTTTELYTTELFLLSRRIEKGGGAVAAAGENWKSQSWAVAGGRATHPIQWPRPAQPARHHRYF